MFDRKLIIVMTVFAAISAGREAAAVTSATTLSVGATVLSGCTVSTLPLLFGNYNPVVGSALDLSTTVTAFCTTGTPFNIGFDQGGGASASIASRKMTSPGSDVMNYTLYREAGRTTLWGNTVGTDTVAATAGVLPTVLTVYGRVFANQNVPSGIYADIVNVTLTY